MRLQRGSPKSDRDADARVRVRNEAHESALRLQRRCDGRGGQIDEDDDDDDDGTDEAGRVAR